MVQNYFRQQNSGSAGGVSLGVALKQKSRMPVITRTKDSVRIQHREFIGSINGSVAFTVQSSIVLQPGLAASFPWLSTQAVGWEQYRFHSLCAEFISRAAETLNGTVILAPDYDVLDAPPASEAIATSYRDCEEDKLSRNFNCVLDPKSMHPMGPRKFVRSGVVANSDLKTYDVGALHVCTVGEADASQVGKLWLCYDVELFIPQLVAGASAPSVSAAAFFGLAANQALTTAVTSTLAFDTTVSNNLGIVNATGVFTLPVGNWHVVAEVGVSGATAATTTLKVEIEKNSAAITLPCIAQRKGDGTENDCELVVSALISSVGTDTARVRVTFTSATGVLVVALQKNRIWFFPV